MNIYYYTYVKFKFVLHVRLRCFHQQNHPVNAEKGKKCIIAKKKKESVNVVLYKMKSF